jgi:hypothetical protein
MLRHRIIRSWRALRAKALWSWRRSHLGDTRSSTEARFGSTLKLWDEHSYFPQHEYAWRDLSIVVALRDDVAAMVWVNSDRQIPADARSALFDIYAAGHAWIEQPDLPRRITSLFAYTPDARGNRYWERSDRRAWACLATIGVGMDDLQFHLDFTCSAWQEVKATRYGSWFVKSRPNGT